MELGLIDRVRGFLARSLVALAAAVGLSVVMSSGALADAVDPGTTIHSQTTIIQEHTAPATSVATPLAAAPVGAASEAVTPAPAATDAASLVTPPEPDSKPVVAPDQPVAPADTTVTAAPVRVAAEMVPAAPPAQTPAPAAPVVPARAQLSTMAGSWVILAANVAVAAVATPAQVAVEIAHTVASLPPVNTPVAPHGLLSGFADQVTATLVPVLQSLRGPMNAALLAGILLPLILLLMAATGRTYGQWLRRAGHVTAARSNPCHMGTSNFATPPLIGFVSVPPPQRGLFFEVVETKGYAN